MKKVSQKFSNKIRTEMLYEQLKPMTDGLQKTYTGKRVLKVKLHYNTFMRIQQLCAYMRINESELITLMSKTIPIDLMDAIKKN